MRIECIGGGPASLYFSILMQQAFPDAEITVHERNRADDTFGWGVVFSEETLGHFREADAQSYDRDRLELRLLGRHRDLLRRHVRDEHRPRLLRPGAPDHAPDLPRTLPRARGRLRFEAEVDDVAALADADLVVGGDGVNSLVRETYAAHFEPSIEWGHCRFAWLGTTLPLEAFTFIFRENEHGLFQVHAYPFEKG